MMKKIFFLLLLISGAGWFQPGNIYAQCATGSCTLGALITPTTTWQTLTIRPGRCRPFNAVAGLSYQFSYCQGGGDPNGIIAEITITDPTVTTGYAYDAWSCGSAGSLTWTCPASGQYYVVITEFFCSSGPTNTTLAYRQLPPPGVGSSCANPVIIPLLPFTLTGLTTCGQGNPYTSANSPCASSWMNGEDLIFRYTTGAAVTIRITLSNTVLSSVGVFVFNGCPTSGGTNCIAVNTSAGACGGGGGNPNESWSGNPVADFTLPSAGTYYIVVSTWPNPTCTDFDINVQVSPSSGGPGNNCYTVSSPTYAPDAFNSGTQISFPDDQYSSVVPLPFPFCFMGSWYNDIVVSSNSLISFDATCSGQYSSWSTVPIPATTPGDIRNTIMGPWQDIDPSVTGTIRYNTYGTAPNRRFVVSWGNVALYYTTCNSQRYTGQITLYETSNIIDNYLQDKPVCVDWNSGNAVQGLHDRSGTVAVTVAGRNNTNWSVTNDAKRFTPTCAPCLMILPVNFLRVYARPVGNTNLVSWETAQEHNSELFTVEHSSNGLVWQAVGTVPAAGNSSSALTYHFSDESPFSPATWYRVKHVDANGELSYSEVVQVISGGAGIVFENLFMQQSQNLLELQVYSAQEGTELQAQVMDASGRVIAKHHFISVAGSNNFTLDLSQASAGVYSVSLTAPGFKETRRIVKY